MYYVLPGGKYIWLVMVASGINFSRYVGQASVVRAESTIDVSTVLTSYFLFHLFD